MNEIISVDINKINTLNVVQKLRMKSQLRIHIVTLDHHIEQITEPMIKMGYVTVETLGRNSIVSITAQRNNTLSIFGNPHSLI
ncbi:MAG: hypothetical protein OEM77_00965 [Nitrosopumilus sp.]|nr:hypothetical protein [Nitrosopumilus sp.]MDH3735625.1 hypothetical protein [Nitrosopumilus sp.]MDH3833646.1 hypothetical protein [Nitrosopumilus sp.]